MAADGQRYASPAASLWEARASAWVSMYSRMLVSWGLNSLWLAASAAALFALAAMRSDLALTNKT